MPSMLLHTPASGLVILRVTVPSAPTRTGTMGRAVSKTLTGWDSLEASVYERHRDLGNHDVADQRNGPTNPDVNVRTFGRDEADIRVKLYRDSAAWCPYCQRVWLLLEEKRIPYRMEKINMRSYGDKPQAFLNKVPSGLLPAIELDGRIVTESADIMMLLEQTFPDRPMLPPVNTEALIPKAVLRAATSLLPIKQAQTDVNEVGVLPGDARLRDAAFALLQLERDIFARWCQWLFRPLSEASERQARALFEEAMQAVDDALAQVGGSGPFFLGKNISMVDLMFVPFLERQNSSLLYWKGVKIRNGAYTNVTRCGSRTASDGRPTRHHMLSQGSVDSTLPRSWFEALEQRSTYTATQSDHYTHCWDIPPQYGTCYPYGGSKYAAIIDGSGDHWKLPLMPLTATSEPEARSNVVDDGYAAIYRIQAAQRLVMNRSAIVRFSLRGMGTPVNRFYAPLADPDAVPNLDYSDVVSSALQFTALALLEGTDSANDALRAIAWLGESPASRADNVLAVEACLSYLRDRVGVPRDLQLPAARQLRAHLNWTIEQTKTLS